MKENNFLKIITSAINFTSNTFKTPIPEGISIEGELRRSHIEFIYDLTYQKKSTAVYEDHIFLKIKEMIKEAKNFIVIDMFLFNDDYDRKYTYKNVSEQLTELLIQKKQESPTIEIIFITDEINTFYGSYPSVYLEKLKDKGVKVITTDLKKIRDPNPIYSKIWRIFFSRLKTDRKGWLGNPFSPDSPKVTFPSYLKLLNMKANHRKVVITENEALVTSLNIHDASSKHSNIALAVKGEIINDILETENAVVRFSGGKAFNFIANTSIEGTHRAQIITEGKIKKVLIEEIQNTKVGDRIRLLMFYLADYEVIEELIEASSRGVDIKIVLDANKDAFGRKKNGVPNRPVAYNLSKKTDGKIKIRWYNTHGEQFHTKFIFFMKEESIVAIGGSANLTRRNIDDYNLETNLKVIYQKNNRQAIKIEEYFTRLWENRDGEYTLDFEAYKEDSIKKQLLYYIQEKTGLSSF